MAVVVLSSEVDEIADLADRALVFRDQTVAAEFNHETISHEATYR